MFHGVDHIGVGVGDLDAALEFYGGDRLQSGAVRLHRRGSRDASFSRRRGAGRGWRCSRTRRRRRSGPGKIKLVQVLDGDGPPPAPAGQGWGEVGVCEVCLHVRGVRAVHDQLVAELGGTVADGAAVGQRACRNDISLDIAYVADPVGRQDRDDRVDGALALAPRPAARRGRQPRRLRGRRHRAGAATSTQRLGFGELLFESTEFFEPMAGLVRPRAARAAHGHDHVRAGGGDRAAAA